MKLENENSNEPLNPQLNIGAVSGSPYNYSEKDVRTNTKVPIKEVVQTSNAFAQGNVMR